MFSDATTVTSLTKGPSLSNFLALMQPCHPEMGGNLQRGQDVMGRENAGLALTIQSICLAHCGFEGAGSDDYLFQRSFLDFHL